MSASPMLATAVKARDMFVPRPLKSVAIGKVTVKLYPIIASSMQPPDRANAFQVNKIALAVPGIDRRAMLDTLSAQLSLSTTLDGTLGDWDHHFNHDWCNFAHLSILLYHNDAEAQVVDTVTAADSAVLLPVQDGAANKCHQANIKFACVQLNLDFSALITLWPSSNTILHAKYYIKVPKDSCNMTIASNQAYCLTIYHGPGDKQAMAAKGFQCDILGITLQDGLVDLLSPTFNLTLERMDHTTLVSKICSKIIMLATPSILDKLQKDSCDMTIASNQAYCLTTYLGPGDLRAMAAKEFQCDILGITLQDALVDLLSPTFNLTSERMDRTTLVSEICSKIIMLATPSILECLFNQLCPGYSKEHHAALDHIRQTYEDAEGDNIFQSVFDYYTQIFGASHSFVYQDPLPVSIYQVFIDGLNSCLIAGFFSHFPNHSISQAFTATHQRKTLE
jgi:hypothetical protein